MTQQINFIGLMSDDLEINLLWTDHNNAHHGCTVTLSMEGEDKLRQLVIYVDGVVEKRIACSDRSREQAAYIRNKI